MKNKLYIILMTLIILMLLSSCQTKQIENNDVIQTSANETSDNETSDTEINDNAISDNEINTNETNDDETSDLESEKVDDSHFYISRIDPDEADDIDDSYLTIVPVQNSKYELIEWDRDYYLYDTIEDSVIHLTGEEGSEEQDWWGGDLDMQDAYFEDDNNNLLVLLSTDEFVAASGGAADFPSQLIYNIKDNTTEKREVSLNEDYTIIPGIDSSVLQLGGSSSLCNSITSTSSEGYLTLTSEPIANPSQSEDHAPTIFYDFSLSENKAYILMVNVETQNIDAMKDQFAAIDGISNVAINNPSLEDANEIFLDYLKETDQSIRQFYENAELGTDTTVTDIPCAYITFTIDDDVDLYGKINDNPITQISDFNFWTESK